MAEQQGVNIAVFLANSDHPQQQHLKTSAEKAAARLRAVREAGLLAGVLGFSLFGLSFIVVDMVFFDIVRHQPEKILNFSHSGYHDMRAYLFDSTVRSATVLTFVGGGAGAILGIVGGWLGNRKFMRRIQRTGRAF